MRIFSPQKKSSQDNFLDANSNKSLIFKTPKKNFLKKINWKFLRKSFLIFTGTILFFIIGIFAYFAKDLPSPGNLNNRFVAESTKIYDRTGNHILYEIHGEEKRTQISLSQIPESVKYATISLEDQNFYNHYGIEIKGIVRAALKDVINLGTAQGGSTITQQLIKRSLLTSQKTFTRKVKEVILAIELEQKFEKDEILEMYLNEIPYGSNAYGIEAAAQTFFSKSAKDLSLDESALLASLPKAPTYYSPLGSHLEDLKSRQEYALTRMSDLGYITKQQALEAKSVNVIEKINPRRENIQAPHFVMYIKEYLEEKFGGQVIEEKGLKVYTTLDWEKQQIAEKAVREGAEKNITKYKAENASLVAIDAKTGQILAMVGSKDYFDKSIDGQVNVAIRDRQPGSSFKPYVYLTAFSKGYTPETQIWDVDTNFSTEEGKEYNPKNYDGKNSGLLQIKNALAMSLNVPAVKVLYLAGVKDSVETAKKMGITSLNYPDRYGLSLVLGGGEVKLLDHVSAYSTLATGGIYHKKTAILRIENKEGNLLEEYMSDPGIRVIDEKYITMLDSILSDNSLRAPVFGENNPLKFSDRPVAAKTGTTNEWRDGWTIGYTPSLTVGVWAGNNDNTAMAEGSDGSYVAAPIWRQFMDEALKNYSIEKFPKYEPEKTGKDVLDGKIEKKVELKVCKIPGTKNDYCLANDNCPGSKIEKEKFSEVHSILYYVKKDDPRSDPPKNSDEYDSQFKNWEKAIKKWVKNNKDYKDAPPEDECKESDFEKYKPSVKIESPSNGESITSPEFSIKVSSSAEFGVNNLILYINGNEATSTENSSINYTYSVPENKKNSTLKIKAEIKDKNDNSDSEEIEINTVIP